MNVKLHLVAITLGAACSIPAVTLADAANDNSYNESKTVKFADLNLSNEADVSELYSRLRIGAGQACGKRVDKPVRLLMEHKACVKSAMSDAVNQVGNEKLASLHSGAPSRQMVSQSDE